MRAAIERGGTVAPVFIWSPDEGTPSQPGGPSRWWLHQSLAVRDGQLRVLGSRLIIWFDAALAVVRGTSDR